MAPNLNLNSSRPGQPADAAVPADRRVLRLDGRRVQGEVDVPPAVLFDGEGGDQRSKISLP